LKEIESAEQANEVGLTRRIADFWTRNVNAERLYGRKVSANERGSEAYFVDLQTQRYRSHTHLPPWIAQIPAGSRTLEIGSGIGLDAFTMASAGVDLTALVENRGTHFKLRIRGVSQSRRLARGLQQPHPDLGIQSHEVLAILGGVKA